MKILVFGKGFLGARIIETWPDAVFANVRIDDAEAVARKLEEEKPDAVINAAGKTGTPNVDWCESHQTETTKSNTIGPLVLANACQEKKIYLLHLGSGCIFYGHSPDPLGWREEDFANPISFYSRTKYSADLLLSKYPNVGIARLRMPVDSIPHARNLIDKLVRYKQIIDVENSVTVVDDLIIALRQLLEKRGTGIFHLVNPGAMRHRELLDLYRTHVDPTHHCEWITDDDLVALGLAVERRSNSILQSPRLQALDIQMRPIHEALLDTMKKYAANLEATRPPTPLTSDNKMSWVIPERQTNDSAHVQSFHFLKQRHKEIRGVILAGGKGTRLAPLTNFTNKHLLPVYNRPMITYPLQTLLDAGVNQILVVTGPDFAGQFMNLLGSGAAYGCHLTYRIQDESGGIAQALNMAENFVDGHNCAIILGDNIFDESFLSDISLFHSGAQTFYKEVDHPERFGVLEIDAIGNVLSLEEKPNNPKSNLAQVGLYIYDNEVFDIIRTLHPSARGELEITDVNNIYLRKGALKAKPVLRFWSDAGTFASLKRASEYFSQKEIGQNTTIKSNVA